MGRAPCCDKANVKKGPWSPEEDAKLKDYIEKHGTGGNWISLPQRAALKRCGKSCRLRWLNYLRPNIKHGDFSDDEDRIICSLYANIGSRWSIIAAQLPGRTDNDIKNYWNTKLKKKLMGMMIHPSQAKLPHQLPASFSSLLHQVSSSLSSSSPSPSTAISSSSAPSYTLARSFAEPVPFSSNNTTFTAAASIFSPQDSSFLAAMQNYQMKDSCSSSDGSCNNQISHDKDLEYEYGGGGASAIEQMGLQNYFYYGVEESQKLVDGSGENPIIDYGLEEIKQLISSSSCSNNFLFEENKTSEGRIMYY